jgi:hypothetical protein
MPSEAQHGWNKSDQVVVPEQIDSQPRLTQNGPELPSAVATMVLQNPIPLRIEELMGRHGDKDSPARS